MTRERVLGWDVLRGLCALAVALYHLLLWQGVAALHTFGSYGVYLFFVLSGASLAYNYQGRIEGAGDALRFLATRWLRLAPLYGVVCAAFLALLAWRSGHWADHLPLRLALNATFGFGVYDPAVTSIAIGGWSLGIEFVLYLAFPFLLLLLVTRIWWIPALAALTALQWFWIQRTAGSAAGYTASAVAYHQVPAFAAYFFGGCVIGAARRARGGAWPLAWGAAAWLAVGGLLLALNGPAQGDELLGMRGAVLFLACFGAVFVSGQVLVGPALAPLARWLGDITYGCYLLHPMFFFGLAWIVWPRLASGEVADAPLAVRLLLLSAVVIASCLAASASERWFEAPVRRWGQRLLASRRPAPAAHIDAASISS